MTRRTSIVIITGATSGFGAAMARRYAESGAKIIAIGRNRERLAALEAELGSQCLGVSLDVADSAAVAAALAALPPEFAEPTVLINNAGLSIGNARIPDASLANWERMVDTNIRGVLNMTHAILPGMVARNYGDVINLSSIAANLAYPAGNVYGASKAFVRQFTLNLRADLLGRNIRAICIEPGTARTGFAAVRLGSEQAATDFYNHPNLLEAEDVADIVYFCTSLPRRVNINTLEVMPISQAFAFPAMATDMPVLDPDDN
jgi:3-hydroxy acid dehydrogenase/malonic semialdehyde reductase